MFQLESFIGQIGAMAYNSSPTEEGYATSYVIVPVSVNNPVDFDYDSQERFIYWVETSSSNVSCLRLITKKKFTPTCEKLVRKQLFLGQCF